MQEKTTLTAPSDIEVIGIKPIMGRGNLKAFADIRIGALEIHGLRIVQQPGQRAWVSMPQAEYERDGVKCYAPMVKIHDKTLKDAVANVVLMSWQKEIRSINGLRGVAR